MVNLALHRGDGLSRLPSSPDDEARNTRDVHPTLAEGAHKRYLAHDDRTHAAGGQDMATNAIIQPGTRKVKTRKTRFGSVTVTAPAPTKAMVQHNVKVSTHALERVTVRLAKAGVRLHARKDVPLYSLDSDDPDVMIRKLNGKVERGNFVDGVFNAIG